ncbi:MAG: hypothetical protein IPJ16_03615 [Bacteroidales bacterium]|nr:hypothetical protein [Bacteroidales bacterium]
MLNSPFKFLDSYTREDREIFFGRDQEITDLYRSVFESKILLVYGVSGTGKSSLINCGLASRFDDSDWLPVNVRRGNNIVDSLSEAFNKQAIRPFKKSMSVAEKLQSIYLDHFKPVYLIFDQFEELFIFGSHEERSGFIKIVKEITESDIHCRIIFIIREEFLASMTEFEAELPDIFTNRFRVEKMKRANAISAIEGPCKVHNIETEEGFSEDLIDKLCPAGNEIELTFLQIYLDRIFRLSVNAEQAPSTQHPAPSTGHPVPGTLRFSKDLLSKAGSVSDLLGQFLEEQIGEMDDPDTATSVLKSFVSIKGTKRPMDESEILSTIGTFGMIISEPVLLKYLTKFVDLRILRERDDAGHFELRHDALAAKIYETFTLIDKELLEVRLFIENAYQAFNSRKTYLTQDDLDYISTYEKRLFLSPSLAQFINDSKEKLKSQQRALKRLTSIVAVMFLIIVAAGIRYYLNKKSSADTRELTTIALLQEKVDPLTSINTAFKILSEDSLSTVSQGIILQSFNKLLQEELDKGNKSIPIELLPRRIPVAGSISSMRTNKTGSRLFGWTDKNEVFTCPVNDSIIHSFIVENEIIRVEMSDNGRYFAVICKNSRGDVFTRDGKKMFSFETTVNHLMNNRLVKFFTNDKYFLAAVKENSALIYDSTGTILFELTGHTGRINSLDISPDNRFVATASCDKSVLIWNFNHRTGLFSPYDTLKRYKPKTLSYADSIIGPNDTIWSCEFNSTGKYILTASADSMIYIWDLDGVLLNEWFVFGMNSIHGAHSFWPLWNQRSTAYDARISKSDIQNSYLESYHKKVYDATFAAKEKAIIASNYSYDNHLDDNRAGVFRTLVQYFDGFSWNFTDNTYSTNQYILKAQSQLVTEPLVPIEYLEISPDRQLFAAVSYNSKTIQIIAQDGYQMASIPGSFAVFSKDGLYLLYVNNNAIRCLPVNLKEIYNLVFDKKVFWKCG